MRSIRCNRYTLLSSEDTCASCVGSNDLCLPCEHSRGSASRCLFFCYRILRTFHSWCYATGRWKTEVTLWCVCPRGVMPSGLYQARFIDYIIGIRSTFLRKKGITYQVRKSRAEYQVSFYEPFGRPCPKGRDDDVMLWRRRFFYVRILTFFMQRKIIRSVNFSRRIEFHSF